MSEQTTLQFRLRYFVEHESTDDFLQGASDEVYLGAIGADSASVRVGPDRKPEAELIHAPPIGDVSSDGVRNQWRINPHVLVSFDLRQPGDWPRTYTTTILIVEHDNGDLAEAFDKLNAAVGDKVRVAIVTATTTAAGAAVGAVIGSSVPGVGTLVGAAVGALAGAAFDAIMPGIKNGLADEIFAPIPITLTLENPRLARPAGVEVELLQKVREHGADYDIVYDWHVVSVATWNGEWFPLPGQHVFDREKQQIAAVSRAPGNLDLFVIGFDNHVYSTFWG